MPPEVAFIFGLTLGTVGLLLIQAFGRRKARQAIAAFDRDAQRNITLLSSENERQTGQIDRLQERLANVERIVTDTGSQLDREIEQLRIKSN